MNARPEDSSDLSRADADFLDHLTDFAATIEPDPTFKANLEAKLMQTQPQKSAQTTHSGTHPIRFTFPQFNRRTSLVACAAFAIGAVFVIPTLTSGEKTLAQAMAAGEVTIASDTQELDETNQTVKATGNVVFSYPAAQIEAKADEGRYTGTSREITLFGNVQITQRGETLRGAKATCSFEQKHCTLTQN